MQYITCTQNLKSISQFSMAQNRFLPSMAVRQPSSIGQPWKKQLTCSLWGTNTLNLKSISQSSIKLSPKIGFNHIWLSVSHFELDDLDKKSHGFLFLGANTQNLKSISQFSTELCSKIGFAHIWRSVGHLELENFKRDLKITIQLFFLRYQCTKFEVNISIQYRVIAQNRFRPYMAVSRPSWIGWPWQIWSQYLNPELSYGQYSTELWPKIAFDHIWRSGGHLESDDLDKKS